MSKLYTVVAVIVGIIVGAFVIYQRTDFGPEATPTPEVQPTATVAPKATPIRTPVPTPRPTPVPTPVPTQTPAPTPAPTQQPTPAPTPELISYTITADDNGFTVDRQPIVFTRGDRAAIKFIVLVDNVAFGGLQFRGGPINTEPIPPGKSQTIFFTPESSFDIKSFWPNSGVMKPYTISVQVNVQ